MSKTVKNKLVKYKPSSLSVSVTASRQSSASIHDKDFYKWVVDQSKLLKKKEFEKLDMENLIEEIEALGRSEKRTLESHFRKLLSHLLKIKYQPSHHTSSWDITVKLARIAVKETLEDNPSLKPKVQEIFTRAYISARLEAASETKIDESIFPKKCLWTVDECMKDAGIPVEVSREKKQKKKSK